MQTVRRAEPRDVIALAWFRLGYRPRDSLVLVGLHGSAAQTGLETGMIVRVELAPVLAAAPRSFGEVAEPLRRAGAEAVIALVVADDVLAAPPPGLVPALGGGLERAGLTLFDVLGVGAAAYRSLLCADAACCPRGGIPLEDVSASRVAADAVLAGFRVAPSEREVVADVLPPPGGAPAGHALPRVPLSRSARRDWWLLWCAASGGGELPPDRAGGLAGALRDRQLRDGVLITVLGAPMGVATLAVLGPGRGRVARIFAPGAPGDLGRLLAVPPGQADAARLERDRSVLAAAARAAPPGHRADALAVLGWLAWYTGSGVRARLLAGLAAADVPGHPLTGLLREALERVVPPPWATAPERRAEIAERGSGP